MISLLDQGLNLNWQSRKGIIGSGGIIFSINTDWNVTLVKDIDKYKVSIFMEPYWNFTSCALSFCVLYPFYYVCDAKALELSVERVNDLIFFTCRQKYLFHEDIILQLKDVTNVTLYDNYSPEEEGSYHFFFLD